MGNQCFKVKKQEQNLDHVYSNELAATVGVVRDTKPTETYSESESELSETLPSDGDSDDSRRMEREAKLSEPTVAKGTYILEPGINKISKMYLLSVRTDHEGPQKTLIEHVRIIRQQFEKKPIYDGVNRFTSLQELITQYSSEPSRFGCLLTEPYTDEHTARCQQINRRDFEFGHVIRFGNFSTIYEGTWGGEKVLLRTLRLQSDNQQWRHEATLLGQLNHNRIVRLLAFSESPDEQLIWFVFEYMPKGDLLRWLKETEGRQQTIGDLVKISKQICEGMAYLKTQNLVHGCLKASKVLLNSDNSVKISGAGLQRILPHYQPPADAVRWMAPEVIVEQKYTSRSDVWSFGVVMFEVFSRGELPYQGTTNDEILTKIGSGYRLPNPLPNPTQSEKQLYDIMCSCWAISATQRPSFKILLGKLCRWQADGQI